MNHPKNLLIVRTDRIGDVVLSLPLAGIVKKHFPDCKVTYLLRDYTKELVLNHPYIDKVITLIQDNGGISIKKNIELLKSENFDASIIVSPTFRISLLLFLSRIKIRVGTGYRWYSFLFNKKIFEHRKFAEKHELEYNVNLLNAFGIYETISIESANFNISVNSTDLNTVKKLISDNDIIQSDKVIILHPGSGGSAIDLPIDKMIELAEEISKINNVKILVTGSESEIDLCNQLVVSENVCNLAGKLNLSELIALISLCDLFISNSTGPIHIAAALNKFTIGFYPKIKACSQKRWGPYTKEKFIFTPEIDCKDCTREQCEKIDCMRSISIGRVIEQVNIALKNS